MAAVHHPAGQCQHFSPSTCALGPECSQLCLCNSDQRGALHRLPAVGQRQCSSPESAAPLGCAGYGAAVAGGYSGLLVCTLLFMHSSSCPCTRVQQRGNKCRHVEHSRLYVVPGMWSTSVAVQEFWCALCELFIHKSATTVDTLSTSDCVLCLRCGGFAVLQWLCLL